jgi:hypothetical protein
LLIFLLAVAIVGAGPVTAEEMHASNGRPFVLLRPWRIPEEEQPERKPHWEKIVLITKDG